MRGWWCPWCGGIVMRNAARAGARGSLQKFAEAPYEISSDEGGFSSKISAVTPSVLSADLFMEGKDDIIK